MTASEVSSIVDKFVDSHPHVLYNTYVYDWEADVFSVTKTGYSYEIEIKVSKSDFKADFKKFKHSMMKSSLNKGWYCLHSFGSYKCWDEFAKDYAEYSPVVINNISSKNCPNKFYYACPRGLIGKDEVPKYAGLIYVDNEKYTVEKKAPWLHKDKFIAKDMLFEKYYWLYTNQKRAIMLSEMTYKRELQKLQHEISRLREAVINPQVPPTAIA